MSIKSRLHIISPKKCNQGNIFLFGNVICRESVVDDTMLRCDTLRIYFRKRV